MSNIENVLSIPDYCGDIGSHVIFSKSLGFGRVTVLGSTFNAYYDDEALMLANAVEYTTSTSNMTVIPNSGTVLPDSSVTLNMFYNTYVQLLCTLIYYILLSYSSHYMYNT